MNATLYLLLHVINESTIKINFEIENFNKMLKIATIVLVHVIVVRGGTTSKYGANDHVAGMVLFITWHKVIVR